MDTLYADTQDTSSVGPYDVAVVIGGFPLYGRDSNGVLWHTTFQQITGLFDGVGTNLSTDKLIWSDGLYSNVPTRGGRSISIEGELMDACPDVLIASWEAFKGHLRVGDQQLTFTLGGITRQVTVKQSAGAPMVKWSGLRVLKFSIGLEALSPYSLSGGAPITGTTSLARTQGGMIFPKDGYHFEGANVESQWLFAESIVSGALILNSSGNAPSPVQIRIDGPVKNPVVTHSPSGRSLSFHITLGAGSYLTADSGTRQILVNGAPPVDGVVANRQWFYAEPGQNIFRFASDDASDGATLTVTFWEAYI